jgi:hypothetical protein
MIQSLNHKVPSISLRKHLTFRVTFYQSSPQVCHTVIIILCGNGLFSQQWYEGYVVQRQVRKYSGARLFSSKMNSWQIVVVSLTTQCVHNYIRLARMIVNLQLAILDQIEPSSLPHIQVRLHEDILQTLVVCIDVNHIPKQIV